METVPLGKVIAAADIAPAPHARLQGLAYAAVTSALVLAACDGGGVGHGTLGGLDGSLPPAPIAQTPPAMQTPRPGEIGSLCARNGDCSSQQCLQVGRCTTSCAAESDCPGSWKCDGVLAAGLLCTCTPTAATETCDGRDDDCNGFVDDGAVCPSGLVCAGGACACPPERSCGDGCADLTSDPNHCGACGSSCGPGGSCLGGACVCGGGLTSCGGACADLSSDPRHCGACGRACAPGSTCSGGACMSYPGGPCASDADCGPGGWCWTEGSGFPGGQCSASCVQGVLDCPGGAVCLVAVCYAGCSADTDCRDGYLCDWLGTCSPDCRLDPAATCGPNACFSDGSCRSSCRDDSDCSAGSYCDGDGDCRCTAATSCGSGQRCNVSSGHCE